MSYMEISRTIPAEFSQMFPGLPIFTAYGCILTEEETDSHYIYTAINLETGRQQILSRRKMPLTTSGVDAMVEKIRQSDVADAGRLEVDTPFGKTSTLSRCREIGDTLFKEILPKHDFRFRAAQAELADQMLETISRRSILLAEAEVGTGKTLAYLVAAILAKRGRLNGFWNMSFYTGTPYVELAHMPIVLATSSIALQKALVSEYIPALSDILLENGIIKTPITAVVRKGREHYVCKRNLQAYLPFERNPETQELLEYLNRPAGRIDLGLVDGLSPYVKRKISVPKHCNPRCPYRKQCQYLPFRLQAQSSQIDIQVCNHNYLLADTLRRAENKKPLIPNYQMLLIDEAHKFLSAARSMYGSAFSCMTLSEVRDCVLALELASKERFIRKTAKTLATESDSLFRDLMRRGTTDSEGEGESQRYTADMGFDTTERLRRILFLSESLSRNLTATKVDEGQIGLKSYILDVLFQVRKKMMPFIRNSENICWVEKGDEVKLCCIPKDLDKQLYRDLWSKGIPTILTSGTLSMDGDFTRIKRTLGLDRIDLRLSETSKASPFDYQKNALLYVSKSIPYPDQTDMEYIKALTDEIENLVSASYGHAAVLFTSYKVMDMVWEKLKRRKLPFPMFQLDRGSTTAIERFKQSGNGILFASGAMWEGIDIPGDALSLLIVVKLPFAVPDPISEYERTLYPTTGAFKNAVTVPDMFIQLCQGCGRPLRNEKDTAVIAIIDSRVDFGSLYHVFGRAATHYCPVTDKVRDVSEFIRVNKPPEYFK